MDVLIVFGLLLFSVNVAQISAASTSPPPVTAAPTCAAGTYGQPPQCSVCGSCAGGQQCDRLTGACVSCTPGYNHTVDNKCTQPCDDHYFGQNCTQKCGNCLSNVACNVKTGSCADCEPGFSFASDTKCKLACRAGLYGLGCADSCSPHCSNTCNSVNGVCTCRTGYKPSLCTHACDPGRWGDKCLSSCSNYCVDNQSCNHVSGHCPCLPGYRIPSCGTRCIAGTYGQNCSERCGFCSDGTNTCDHITGQCARCKDNRKPPLCKECLAGQWGSECGQRCGQCGGDGRCQQATGICLYSSCLEGWITSSCDVKCSPGWYGLNCSKQCGHCKDNSICRHDNGVCEQDCEGDYEGVLCLRTKESLTGAIVGSILGSGILIALAVVGAVCYMKRFSTSRKESPNPQGNEFTGMTLAESFPSRTSQVYQNTSCSPVSDPNYDPLMLHERNNHAYSGHAPGKFEGQAKEDHLYQNTDFPSESLSSVDGNNKKGKRKGRNPAHDQPEATYGNIIS